MIIDSHTHVFSSELIANRNEYARRDPFFGQLYSGVAARMIDAAGLIAAMDAAGVDKAVVVGWPWQSHEVCVEQNTWTMQAVRQYPNRLYGLAAIQPSAGPVALAELERCMAGGMIGLGELNADGQRFRLDDADLLSVARKAAELQVPVLLHTNEPVGHDYPGKGRLPLADVYALVKAVPDLSLVLAHWGAGFPFYELMPEVKRAASNVYYDSAASPLLYAPQIFRTVIDLVGSDKVLFGSDFPLILYPKRQSEPDYKTFLDEIRGLNMTAEEWENVMARNSLRVFRFR